MARHQTARRSLREIKNSLFSRRVISDTRRRLKEWGLWACGGEPSLSSMFKSMFGRGAQDLREMPPHIQEIDHIVCIASPEIRAMLIKFYCSSGSYQEKAEALGLDKRNFRRRLDRADYFVNSILDGVAEKAYTSRQNAPTRRKGPPIHPHPEILEPA